MKLQSTNNQYQSTVTGKKIKMGFAADAASHLAELMSNSVYQDKYGSIVREVVSNAIDANVESSSTRKVEVSIVEKPALSDGVGYLVVKDFGPGISPERIENIFTQYFASTKRDSNEQIGGFGIGAKSPFAYTPVFTVITKINGVKRTYLMEKTTGDRTCTLIEEIEVPGLISGTTIKIPIQDKYDEAKFVKAISKQLILLSDRLIINIPASHTFYMPKVIDFGSIFCIEQEDGTFMEHDGIMLSLGDILYQIPHLDTSRHYCPVNYVLKFDIGEISPTLSREGIEMNDNANVLIHNKAHDVTTLIEEKWVPAQSKPTTDLKKLVGSREKQGPNFPGTTSPVLHYNTYSDMARKFTVKAQPIGWPLDIDLWKFNQIIQSVVTISHRYNKDRDRFTSTNALALMRDVIKQDSYQNHDSIIKRQGDSLAGVWKEWFKDTKPFKTNKSIAILTISTDIKHHINHLYKNDLRDREDAEQIVAEIEEVVVTSLNGWLKDKPKFRDFQPTEEWLEARKSKRKVQRTTKWTKDALTESCPTRCITSGIVNRRTLTYKQIKMPGNVVIANKHYKELNIPVDVKQPVTFIIVSEGNYKRCVAAGAHCWSIDDINRINKRREQTKLEENKIKAINIWQDNHLDQSTKTIFNAGQSVYGKLRIKSRLVVRLKDVHYYAHVDSFVEEMTDKDKILYDGRLYSREKFEKINENFTKIMQRKACTKLLMNILGSASYSNHNNLYKELLISLNLPTNG